MPCLNKPEIPLEYFTDYFNIGSYWYVSFFDIGSISVLENYIPADTLTDILKGSITLLLDNSFEAFTDIIEPLYQKYVIELHIPEENIILLSENADIAAEVQRVSTLLQLKSIKCKWIRRFERGVSYRMRYLMPSRTLQYKIYSKKFLNFNRRWRLHRPTFVAFLKVRKLLHMGYVSLGACDGASWNSVWDSMLESHRSDPVLLRELELHEEEIKNLQPMYLDTNDLNTNQAVVSNSSFYLYEDTYFSIISETNYYTGTGRFLSEKIFKPVALKHPFLLISRPFTLQLLKEVGYRTFSPYINEEYDNETDDIKRMQMILDETDRLSYLTEQELRDFLNGVREICEFNYAVLKNKRLFTTDLN